MTRFYNEYCMGKFNRHNEDECIKQNCVIAEQVYIDMLKSNNCENRLKVTQNVADSSLCVDLNASK